MSEHKAIGYSKPERGFGDDLADAVHALYVACPLAPCSGRALTRVGMAVHLEDRHRDVDPSTDEIDRLVARAFVARGQAVGTDDVNAR